MWSIPAANSSRTTPSTPRSISEAVASGRTGTWSASEGRAVADARHRLSIWLEKRYHLAGFKIRCEDYVGFRFQKRISILPGVRINLSKSGASASVGPRGADLNIGKDGITANAGLPGTGLSYRQKVGRGGGASARAGATTKKSGWLAVLLVIGGLAAWAFQ